MNQKKKRHKKKETPFFWFFSVFSDDRSAVNNGYVQRSSSVLLRGMLTTSDVFSATEKKLMRLKNLDSKNLDPSFPAKLVAATGFSGNRCDSGNGTISLTN